MNLRSLLIAMTILGALAGCASLPAPVPQALPALGATDAKDRITLVTNSLELTDEPLELGHPQHRDGPGHRQSRHRVRTLLTLFGQNVAENAFRLRLTPDGKAVEWVQTNADGSQNVHLEEPGHTWWPRFQIWLLSPFVDAELL